MQNVKDIGERTFEFALRIVRLCQVLDQQPGVSRTIGRQVLRSGTSIGANLREAKAGQSKPDFIAKCSISLKEAHENEYWLSLLSASGIIQEKRIEDLISECQEIIAILTTIIKKAKSSDHR